MDNFFVFTEKELEAQEKLLGVKFDLISKVSPLYFKRKGLSLLSYDLEDRVCSCQFSEIGVGDTIEFIARTTCFDDGRETEELRIGKVVGIGSELTIDYLTDWVNHD